MILGKLSVSLVESLRLLKGNGRLQLGSGRCCCYIIWESGKHL